jgi:hypothetical protein
MSYSALRLILTGEAPLVMANGQLADPLNPLARLLRSFTAKRRKTDADHEKIAEIEFLGSLWLDGEQPCIPAEAIEAAFVEAARRKRLGRAARAGLICPANARLRYDGPTRPEELWRHAEYRLRVPVRVQAHRVMRTRPLFPIWSAAVELHYLPSLLNEREVLEILRLAGEQVGLGGWRPRFGRFAVAQAADGEAVESVAARPGGAGPGLARQALARHGKTRQGKAGQGERGRAGRR